MTDTAVTDFLSSKISIAWAAVKFVRSKHVVQLLTHTKRSHFGVLQPLHSSLWVQKKVSPRLQRYWQILMLSKQSRQRGRTKTALCEDVNKSDLWLKRCSIRWLGVTSAALSAKPWHGRRPTKPRKPVAKSKCDLTTVHLAQHNLVENPGFRENLYWTCSDIIKVPPARVARQTPPWQITPLPRSPLLGRR